MKKMLPANLWAHAVCSSTTASERDRLIGVTFTLAAKLLDVSRSRVHQLANASKLSVVDVFDGNARIGHLVTIASIDRRRKTVRPRRTQWRARGY